MGWVRLLTLSLLPGTVFAVFGCLEINMLSLLIYLTRGIHHTSRQPMLGDGVEEGGGAGGGDIGDCMNS